MKRSMYLVGVVLLLGLAVGYAVWKEQGHARENVTVARNGEDIAASKLADGDNATDQTAEASSAAVAPRADSFDRTKDLNAYIRRLEIEGRPKGYVYVAEAKAIEECGALKVVPGYADKMIKYFQKSNYPNASIQVEMMKRLKGRCEPFSEANTLGRSDIHNLYRQAAEKGNAEAQAHLLVTDYADLPKNTVLSRAVGIINTRDPSAVFELSGLFGPNGPLGITGEAIGSAQSEWAWKLVACDLGLDCSHSSALVQQSCLFGGMCGTGDYREILQQSGVTPRQFEETLRLENKIIGELNNGSVSRIVTAK